MENNKDDILIKLYVNDALDDLPFGVYIINNNGVIEYFNKAMQKISGVESYEKVVNTNIFESPNYKKYGLSEHFQKAFSGEPFHIDEIKYTSRAGKTTYRQYHGIPIKDEKGEIEKIMCIVEDITERKKIQNELKETLEKFKNLFENSQDAIFLADTETGNIVEVNQAAADLMKMTKDQLIGIHQSLLHPPEKREEYMQIFKNHIILKKAIDTDLYIRNSESEDIPVEISASVIEVNGKSLNQGIFRDITEKKKAEVEVNKAQEQVKYYLDVIGVMLIFLDKEGRLQLINKKGTNILGYKEHEIVGKDWFDKFIPRDYRQEVREVFQKIITEKQGLPEYFENPIVTKDGQERLIAWHNTAVKNDEDQIVGIFSSGEDITEYKKAVARLKESEERMNGLAEATSEGILLHENGRIIEANKAFTKMFKYTLAELIGESLLEFIDQPDRDKVLRNIHSNNLKPYQVIAIKKDGTKFRVEIVGRSIAYKDKKVRVSIFREMNNEL